MRDYHSVQGIRVVSVTGYLLDKGFVCRFGRTNYCLGNKAIVQSFLHVRLVKSLFRSWAEGHGILAQFRYATGELKIKHKEEKNRRLVSMSVRNGLIPRNPILLFTYVLEVWPTSLPLSLEIAIALEASRQQFIWVRREKNNQEDEEQWLPEGFEERMEGKGLIIRGWAPQVLILDHEAIGGFVTHCGWNSTLEGITAGKPMVTWPVSAEQFYNEKLVIEVLKIGIGVGVKEWVKWHGDHVESKAIEKAITRIMVGQEAEEMRSRSKKLGEMARQAVEEGGSSYSDFNALVEELSWRRP
ncbi:hypothetical protein GH714_033782 [Hevea brasiliensis]|uniref:anthocyanidin 3-O-glucosyltransferase n=1 Tax=Hevea brasiliensis TaxID=3981 RepID=A0A6A6NA43_HEVBR|nr:hypothetical protein GH714_033782 [Hevea brasiliensis]